MDNPEEYNFRQRVESLMAQVPYGRVVTYGDVAVACGSPRSARIVGSIAHYGPSELPWHRLVNRFGGMAAGYHGGRLKQQTDLEREGVVFNDSLIIINFEEYRWYPIKNL